MEERRRFWLIDIYKERERNGESVSVSTPDRIEWALNRFTSAFPQSQTHLNPSFTFISPHAHFKNPPSLNVLLLETF